MKKVFIAATSQNDGKTTLSLGLVKNLQARFRNVSFIKPIGQRYLEEDGVKIDEDSILIEEVCGIRCGLKDMSPVAVERGFTERYISKPDPQAISRRIRDAYQRVSRGSELVIIEGTGHAGVGAVFDHSNASVARLLGAKVVIISSGGVGKPIDEIFLNKTLFEKEGVKVMGVIVNKVLPSKYEKISQLVRRGLQRKGLRVLGVLPFDPFLSRFTIEQVLEETDFEILSGQEYCNRAIARVVIGAMKPQDALRFIGDDSLLITPGDREDIISAALECFRESDKGSLKVSGVIFSCGMVPNELVMQELKSARLPVLLAKEDTYSVAAQIYNMTVKIRSGDTEKIERVVSMVREHIEIEAILKGM